MSSMSRTILTANLPMLRARRTSGLSKARVAAEIAASTALLNAEKADISDAPLADFVGNKTVSDVRAAPKRAMIRLSRGLFVPNGGHV